MHAHRRPLSPHLQIYRFPLTVVLSITHRLTGALLALANVALVLWLIAVALDDASMYETLHGWFASVPGRLLLVAWSAILYFHLCNGVRHLFWDAGYGFDLRTTDLTAVAVLLVTATLTALTWWLILAGAS